MLANTPDGLKKALNATVKRVGTDVQTDIIDQTQEKYYIQGKAIRQTLKITHSEGALQIISRGKRLNLVRYKISPNKVPKHKRTLYGAVRRGPLKAFPRGFLIKFKRTQNTWAFRRIGKGEWNIKPIIAPAIPQLIQNQNTISYISQHAKQRFNDRLNHEILRVLGVFTK